MKKSAPSLLPAQRLQRVARLSRANGWGVFWVCVASALVMALQRHWFEAGFALLGVSAGAMELNGRRRAMTGDLAGFDWLIGAQLWLLMLIAVYCGWRWFHFNVDELWAQLPAFMQTNIDNQLAAAGLDPAMERPLLLELTHRLTCVVLMFVALGYQGGMALYYSLQRRAIAAVPAGSEPPVLA